MQYIYYLIGIAILNLSIACSNPVPINQDTGNNLKQNLDGSITIQGRVLVEGTNEPPKGITAVNIANKWKFSTPDGIGQNEAVFVDKDGYYVITIQKGDTLTLMPSILYYKSNTPQYTLINLDHNQTHNFTIKLDSTNYKNAAKNAPDFLQEIEKEFDRVNLKKMVTISGTVINKTTGKPISGLPVSQRLIRNSTGSGSLHLTNKEGQFTITVPQYSTIDFNVLSKTRSATLYTSKDTIVNIQL